MISPYSGSGIAARAANYREDYIAYYNSFADAESPKLRDSNPSVVVIPGLGLFGFAKDKREARITTEFFVNAIHVMAGANALEGDGRPPTRSRRRSGPSMPAHFTSFHNYVALPRLEAFRIEYWALEEAKLQRMPPEREFSRKIALVVGGGSGIGRDVVLQLAEARRARRRGRSECRTPRRRPPTQPRQRLVGRNGARGRIGPRQSRRPSARRLPAPC